MGARSIPETPWTDFQHQDCFDSHEEANEVLHKLATSFAQLNIATDFLLMKTDPDPSNTELQLACLIKEGIATLQDQVTELYHILNQEDSPTSMLAQ